MLNRCGNLIREARQALKLSQEKLARLVQVPQPTISAWETGKQTPEESRLSLLPKHLGIDLLLLVRARDSDLAAACPQNNIYEVPQGKALVAEDVWAMCVLLEQATGKPIREILLVLLKEHLGERTE